MRRGIDFVAYDDENAHILGAKVLQAGGLLYHDFVDSHGPLMFMLAHAYGALAGWAWPNGVRLFPIAATMVAAGAVAACPLLRGTITRLLACALFAALLATVWVQQALYLFDFYGLGGSLATILLAGFALPAIAGRPSPAVLAAASGASSVLLIAAAYSFGPSAMLLAGAGLAASRGDGMKTSACWFAAAAAAAVVIWGLWMLRHADPRGYLAFHIAENQFDYGPIVHISLRNALPSFLPRAAPLVRVQGLAVIWMAIGSTACLASAALRPAPEIGRRGTLASVCLVVVGIAALNARGDTIFKDAAFLVAAFALAAIGLGDLAQHLRPSARAALLAGAALSLAATTLAARGALYTPFGFAPHALPPPPYGPLGARRNTPLALAIRAVVAPNQRMLDLIFNPGIYLAADRLPMQGYYAWWAWDRMYASKTPWFGQRRDLCAALHTAPPRLIALEYPPDGWPQPELYAPCLDAVLAADYRQMPSVAGYTGRLFLRTHPGG